MNTKHIAIMTTLALGIGSAAILLSKESSSNIDDNTVATQPSSVTHRSKLAPVSKRTMTPSQLIQVEQQPVQGLSPAPVDELENDASLELTRNRIRAIDEEIEAQGLVELANSGDISETQFSRLGALLRQRSSLSMKLADQVLAKLEQEERKDRQLDALAQADEDIEARG